MTRTNSTNELLESSKENKRKFGVPMPETESVTHETITRGTMLIGQDGIRAVSGGHGGSDRKNEWWRDGEGNMRLGAKAGGHQHCSWRQLKDLGTLSLRNRNGLSNKGHLMMAEGTGIRRGKE